MKRIEHLGIAVKDLETAEKIFTDVLGFEPFKREEVADENVITSFFQTGESKVELLQSTSDDGPIARHIEKRGEGLHHIAFHIDDINAEISKSPELYHQTKKWAKLSENISRQKAMLSAASHHLDIHLRNFNENKILFNLNNT